MKPYKVTDFLLFFKEKQNFKYGKRRFVFGSSGFSDPFSKITPSIKKQKFNSLFSIGYEFHGILEFRIGYYEQFRAY